MSKKPHYQIVSVGSAVRDISFKTDLAEVINNPKKDPTKLKLIAFEYGAKIRSDEISFTVGGGAANTAVGLRKLGLKNAVLVRVGNDEEGEAIVNSFKKAKVDTQIIQFDKTVQTGFSFLVIETKTHEHVALVNYGANETLVLSPKHLNAFSTDWFYVSSLSQPNWAKDMAALVKRPAQIAWNPGATQLAKPNVVKKLLQDITVLILNNDEATELAMATGMKSQNSTQQPKVKELLVHLQSFGPLQVVITNGRKGTNVFDGKNFYFAKPAPDKPVDTTGAGDCFGSSYIAGLIKYNGKIEPSLKLAIVNSTSLVSKPGAQNGLLTWPEAQRKIKKL